ncbi:hypothetical protein [Actinomadura sp. 7K507]|uniref:hypothetical protein n=1 Tax=Actinomadura sp. 7K507 TaxID=2530365 RepID=UPI0010499081|nr:hypothetical protein [Actinomadura sp. 7K507]TDC90150.1 hypothetical protein E1285_15220 [Actinomadura sp. 7K507]
MRWRHDSWVTRGGLGLAVLVLLGGGYLLLRPDSPEERLSEICGGMLPARDTLGMIFDADDLDIEDRLIGDSAGVPELSRRCKANNILVTIEPATGTGRPFGTRAFKPRHQAMPVPLGSGWTGFVVRDDDSDTAEVLLGCDGWPFLEAKGLLVTVRDGYGADMDPRHRADIARLVTDIARRAAEKTGCDTEPGSRIEGIAPLPPETFSRVSGATGTCKGMTSRPSARETPAGISPVEYCVLKDGLVLTAAYGPYPKIDPEADDPAGVSASSMWGTAACEGVLETAYYRAVPRDYTRNLAAGDGASEDDAEPPTEAELADLARFAEASAARHGCEAPVLPSGADA